MSYTEWYTVHEKDCIRAYLNLPEVIREEVTVNDLASQMFESERIDTYPINWNDDLINPIKSLV